jgi:hypothetical protein
MVYLKFQIVCRQERVELRALKIEKKMPREVKIKRKVCVWKRKKKYRKVKKEKNMCTRKKEEEWQERYERDESSE